jgi:head-tail adaptor
VRAVNEWRDRDASGGGGGGVGADGSGPKAAARSVTAAQRLAAQLEAEREEMSLRIRQQKEEAEQRLRQVGRNIFLLYCDVAAAMMGDFSSTLMCAHLVHRCFWINMDGLICCYSLVYDVAV